MAVPERVAWAVERVAPRPGMRVLEIGFGRGVAVDLLCRAGAVVTGVDRSARMVEVASRRNAEHVAAGVADLRLGTLADVTGSFDAVLAVNVNAFWTAPRDLAPVTAALAPGGVLHLCYEPPTAAQVETIADRIRPALAGFTVQTATRGDRLLCITAR
ncbi:SAM-dependent methyltransferase [Actinokineospora soli]|uniref:SAM-dependent methyltransferase n=1 Tax=Actinokineospora soli TaxID=1048753 RepID=A0ABW2TUZ5_9PSEU